MKLLTLFFLILLSLSLNAHTWIEGPKLTNNDLLSASAADDSVAWVCGKNGSVFLTTSGGKAWLNRSGSSALAGLDLVHVFGQNANTAFVIANPVTDQQTKGTSAYLFRTADRGLNWQKVLSINGSQGNSVFMFNAKRGIFAGNPLNGKWQIWLTNDGGLTWDSTGVTIASPASGEISYANGMFGDLDTHTLMFGTNKGHYFISRDFGKTWQSKTVTGITEIHCINFADSTHGVLAGTGLLKTTNGGQTWKDNYSVSIGKGVITAIISHDFWNFFLIRTGGGDDNGSHVYHSANFTDSNWDTSYTAKDGKAFMHFASARNGGYIFGVRQGGGVSVATHEDPPVTGVSDKNKTPLDFTLGQNYPNPFNPVTKIDYSFPQSSFVTLKVYDVLGNLIATLVNEEKAAGNYTVGFDGSSLPSGFYIYEIRTNTGFSMSRKMVLLK